MPRRMTRPQIVMELTARHIEQVGLQQGATTPDTERASRLPATHGRTEPCSVLSAFDRAQRAARGRTLRAQRPGRHGHRRAHHPAEFMEALRLLSDHLSGEPITQDLYAPLGVSEEEYRRTVIRHWGEAEGRTAEEAAGLIRDAAFHGC
ncbi:hypothetical protein F7Q99_36210 [Streptomyces kaniharaensis]|uniref:Uncharacterized protein n=1 Tax=Streptomyces kaniharaensis TaxID=212423 RepID=A0A6N7L3V0_9ACTN|nr:DUF6197 family protein [Streptomyces kaniharaensis]MQS17487.1 hypothetical protein [Streptomyces kaniharaensis]